jgi:hypothetical protein
MSDLFKLWFFYTVHMPVMLMRYEFGKAHLRADGAKPMTDNGGYYAIGNSE